MSKVIASAIVSFFSGITNWSNAKVNNYGAQYYTFAIFGLINYPLALVYEYYVYNNAHGLYLRCFSTFLCLVLLLHSKWNKIFEKYLALYWYVVIMVTVPTLTIFLLLDSKFSLGYLINFNVGVMIVILLVDWVSFIIIEVIGIIVGLGAYYLIQHTIPTLPRNDYISLFCYMFFCIVILGSIFTRNREIYTNRKNKIKDELNFELEKKVAKRTLALEKALSAKTEFLNNISHEIRTPIQAFSTLSDTLYGCWDKIEDTKKKYYIHQIYTSADRLIHLVGGLLDMSKYQEGKMFFNCHDMDLKELIEGVIDECATLYLNGKDIKIIPCKIFHAKIVADKERIGQVVRNILVNAIKYSSSDAANTINVSMERTVISDDSVEESEAVHVTIRDEGVGIPNGELDEIFTPFTQSSRTKTGAGGTGLGLSIAKEIILGHNGKIWAENNKNTGASFHFILRTNLNNKIVEL